MNRKNKQLLKSLKNEFGSAAENTEIPQKLQKDEIVELIESRGVKNAPVIPDSSGNILRLYRATALVATLAIVIVCALCAQLFRDKQPTVSSDGFDVVLGEIRNAKNYDEIKQIIISQNDSAAKGNQAGVKPSEAQPTTSAKQDEPTTVPDSQGLTPSVPDSLAGIVGIEYDGAYLVKADGEYIYIATTGKDKETGRDIPKVLIIKAYPLDAMEFVAAISIPGENSEDIIDKIVGIHLVGGRLVVLINRDYSGKKCESVSVVYDVSNKKSPVMLRELVQDGEYVTSMILNGRLYMVSSYVVSVQAGANAESYIPTYTDNGESHLFNADKIYCGVTNPESSYLVITTADIANPDSKVGTQAILGCGSKIYFSANTLVAARQFTKVVDGSKEQYTELYCFSITQNGVEFKGSNVIEGTPTDLISVDEYDGSIKIAAQDTVGKAVGDSVYIFSDKMDKVSRYAHLD